MYHSPMELSTSRKNSELTLELINNSCAVEYPEGLVSILTNGEDKIAKFTVNIIPELSLHEKKSFLIEKKSFIKT